MKTGLCVLAAALLAGGVCASERVVLVDEGVAKCRVVLAADASPSERLAKAELEKYFAVATGCGALDGAYPIALRAGGGEAESFTLEVTADGMTIAGGDEAGLVFGVYEVLKRCAGMRWLTPGEDGEYCVHKGKTISVPCGKTTRKPHFRVRTTIGDEINVAWWHARNGMQTESGDWKCLRDPDLPTMEALGLYHGPGGGHVLGRLVSGEEGLERTYDEHPEFYALVDGKRVKGDDAHAPNPCVSNPATLDRMAESLVRAIRPGVRYGAYIIGNNDTTVWCTCEKCRALDAPEAKNTRGELSDRYWYMVNEIARRVWKTRPEIRLGGWAYQNFWYAPLRVKPDPRLYVMISFNNQCWRHSCMDASCPVNKEMVKIYAGWKRLGMPLVVNRDEIGAWDGTGSPGCEFEPSETVLVRNFREYDALGCGGSSFCVNSPFPAFTPWASKWAPFFGKRYHWYAMWQTCYLSAKAMWNPGFDAEEALEEANRLYYGAAWEPAMREFRALLTDCFLKTPGCIGWGQGASVGRCLDRPGSEEKLVALLEQAVRAAEAAGDARALGHGKREQEIFELTWRKARKTYVESYREMTAYKRTGEIAVDGVLDEPDWQTADSYENFQISPWLRKTFKSVQKTYLKVVYDRDHLYFGVTAMEPTPEKTVAGEKVDRFAEGVANLGNHLELWYSYPDMGQAAWHMMINSKGQIIDALQKSASDRDLSVITKAKWAVKTFPDRWTLEMAIPCSEIGQNILDGMTWKINCARVREVEGQEKAELSTAASGLFHGTSGFVNVKFVPTRQGTGAKDAAAWKNATLNDLEVNNARHPNFRWKRWTSERTPKGWGCTGAGETKEHADKPGDFYVSFSDGELSQWYRPFAAGNNRLTFRARGKGAIDMVLYNYVQHPDPNARGSLQLSEYAPSQPRFVLTSDWQTFTAERKSLGKPTEQISVRFICGKDTTAEIDDVYMTPCE